MRDRQFRTTTERSSARESRGEPTRRQPGRPHIARLAVFATFLLTMFYLVAVRRVIDIEAVRAAIASAGPLAPLVYIPVSAVLATVFVPGRSGRRQ